MRTDTTLKISKNIIIDTDAGQDDLMAIALLMNCPGINIEAVTVCNGLAHVEAGADNIARMFAATGKNIPVFAGPPSPMQGERCFPSAWRTLSDTLPGALPEDITGLVEPENAVDYLLRRCDDHNEPFDILALGPLTNLGQVYQQNPDAFRSIREITLMGGAFHVPGNVFNFGEFISPSNLVEWNFFVDPVAAHFVCSSGVPLVFVPLDATNKVRIYSQFVDQFLNLPLTATGRVVGAILHSASHLIHIGKYYAWDPLAAFALIDKSTFQFAALSFAVITAGSDAGQTQIVKDGSCMAQVAIDADRARFFDYFIKAFTEF